MHQSYGLQIFSDSSDIYSTKCFLFSLKCTKFGSVWGSAPDPAGGAYRAPRPPSWIWLGSRRAPTENFWSNPLFKTLATALCCVGKLLFRQYAAMAYLGFHEGDHIFSGH